MPKRPPPGPQAWHGVARSLLIPLIVRAKAPLWCPWLDPHDGRARELLERTGQTRHDVPTDLPTDINILWRTCTIKAIGQHFFDEHATALGVNLGAGLSDYFQWLDQGRNHWLDADQPEVIAWRRQHMPCHGPRHTLSSVNLRQAGWWQRLHLQQHPGPLLLVCEGVLMYMPPAEVQAFLQDIGEHAPAGSELVCDFISPLGMGQTIPANRHEGDDAPFTWGTRHAQDLTGAHARLQLLAEHSVAEAYGPCGPWLQALCDPLMGGPLYALAHLRVNEHPR